MRPNETESEGSSEGECSEQCSEGLQETKVRRLTLLSEKAERVIQAEQRVEATLMRVEHVVSVREASGLNVPVRQCCQQAHREEKEGEETERTARPRQRGTESKGGTMRQLRGERQEVRDTKRRVTKAVEE